MGYFSNFENYFPTLQEWVRYEGDIAWDKYTILKNHGNYVEMMFPSSAPKGHDTYNLYFNDSGVLIMAEGHEGNAGFVGKRKIGNY